MSVWPAHARILADGYALAQDPDVRRTAFDDGMIRQEKRYRSALEVRRIVAWLATDADLAQFRAWARASAHTWFAWTDEAGVARRVRVRGGAGGISYTARIGPDRRRSWEAALELEGAPGDVV